MVQCSFLQRRLERIVDNDRGYIESRRHNRWLLTRLLVNTQSALPALSAQILSTFLPGPTLLASTVKMLCWPPDTLPRGQRTWPLRSSTCVETSLLGRGLTQQWWMAVDRGTPRWRNKDERILSHKSSIIIIEFYFTQDTRLHVGTRHLR